MNVSAAYIREFTSQLDALDERSKKLIQRSLDRLNIEKRLLDGDADAYEDLANVMREVTHASAQLSSAMTAKYYNGIREASNVKGKYTAEKYDLLDLAEVAAATYAVSKEYATNRATAALLDNLSGVNSRFTHYASNETVRRNAVKDPGKPKYVIVPSPTACVFCCMRAGAGYQFPSEASVHSHNNCKCQAVQVYGNSKVQGFDPKAYEDEFFEARRAYRDGDISEEMQRRIEREHERHDERYRNGEIENKWTETNAVLMVWREQRGRQ